MTLKMSAQESTAHRTFITTLVAGSVIVGALALWELKVVVALFLAAVTIAAAMRPGVEALARWRVPRPIGVLIHYLVLLGLLALFLSFVVPILTTQVEAALSTARSGHAAGSGGIKAQILNDLQKRLRHLPSADKVIHPALAVGVKAFEMVIAIFFTFAAAAYWLFERDHAVDLVASLIARPKRKRFRDTWDLIDLKLGAFVRGEILLIVFVGIVASVVFWIVGEPYWLLIGIATGILETVPVVGPLIAFVLATGVGLTASWHVAAFAAGALLAIRLSEDYLVTPRVLGGAVGLSPLLVMVSVAATGILLGGFYVLLTIPIASIVATLVDVIVLGTNPADVETPVVLFPSQDAEA
jgi:predicted PurR-regulated permease PerM